MRGDSGFFFDISVCMRIVHMYSYGPKVSYWGLRLELLKNMEEGILDFQYMYGYSVAKIALPAAIAQSGS